MDNKHDANELALLYNEITQVCELDNNTSVADAREHVLSLLRDGKAARQVCNQDDFQATDIPIMVIRIVGAFESIRTRIITDAREAAARDDVEEMKNTFHSIIAAIEDGPFQGQSEILNIISHYMDSINELPLWSTVSAVLAVYPAERSINRVTFFRDVHDLHPLVKRQSELLIEYLEINEATEDEKWMARLAIGRAVAATRHFDSTHDFENVLVDGGNVDYVRWISESKNSRASV